MDRTQKIFDNLQSNLAELQEIQNAKFISAMEGLDKDGEDKDKVYFKDSYRRFEELKKAKDVVGLNELVSELKKHLK